MKKFSYLLVLLAVFPLIYGCNKTVDTLAKEPKWDRDVCARCAMQVSDPLHSAQIVDGISGKRYYFDDIGCAALWMQDGKFAWSKTAKLYFTDGLNGSWIKSDDAIFAHDFVTPMSFGVATFQNKQSVPEGKTIISYDEAVKRFNDIRQSRMKKHAAPDNGTKPKSMGGMN